MPIWPTMVHESYSDRDAAGASACREAERLRQRRLRDASGRSGFVRVALRPPAST
jgi:hypothetical protein